MEVTISMDGLLPVDQAADLAEWLRAERIVGVESITQKEIPPAPGEQGPTLLAIVGVILGARATVELVKSLHRWIEARTPSVEVKIEVNGKVITVIATNPPDLDGLVRQITNTKNG